MNPIQGVDYGAYYFFRNQRNSGPINLEPIMQVVNHLGAYLALGLMTVACLALLFIRGRFRAAGIFGGAVVLGVLLGEGLKILVRRPRPPDAEIWLGKDGVSSSFPSISALLSCLVLFWLGRVVGRGLFQALCVILVLLIGTSQLYLGTHFLTDLLAGWTAGLLLALAAVYLDGRPLTPAPLPRRGGEGLG